MIIRLSVSNFAIIDELNLSFDKGLTIITGETGAGKSILLGALRLILGERADLKQLNNPEKKCVIEAIFDISKLNLESFFETYDLDDDPECILRRELLPGGKSRAFINDTPVNLNIIQEIGSKLIDIHSQFNTQNLIEQDFQLQILDACANQIESIKSFKSVLQHRNKLKNELKSLVENLNNFNKEADYKQFLLDELTNSNLKAGELEELENEQQELKHTEEIKISLNETITRLNEDEYGVLSQLNHIILLLQKTSGYGQSFEEFHKRMDSVRIESDDLEKEISAKLQSLEADPERLNEITERLDLIHHLLNKHGVQGIEDLIAIKEKLEKESADTHELELKINQLETEIDSVNNKLKKEANSISNARKKIIPEVEKELLKSLSKLGMENSAIKIGLKDRNEFAANGNDEIEFLFSANKGGQLLEIGKSVSGGERSRLMLAVKKLLAGKLELPTLILDEIDTGVSGKVADEVGNMMKEMAENLQLISITHLPQVAAKANSHLKVRKYTANGKTTTQVSKLSSEERINEIASLISGSDISDSAIKQAELLMKS